MEIVIWLKIRIPIIPGLHSDTMKYANWEALANCFFDNFGSLSPLDGLHGVCAIPRFKLACLRCAHFKAFPSFPSLRTVELSMSQGDCSISQKKVSIFSAEIEAINLQFLWNVWVSACDLASMASTSSEAWLAGRRFAAGCRAHNYCSGCIKITVNCTFCYFVVQGRCFYGRVFFQIDSCCTIHCALCGILRACVCVWFMFLFPYCQLKTLLSATLFCGPHEVHEVH